MFFLHQEYATIFSVGAHIMFRRFRYKEIGLKLERHGMKWKRVTSRVWMIDEGRNGKIMCYKRCTVKLQYNPFNIFK